MVLKAIHKHQLGELKTQFDFDFFGFGKDAGQTTIHLVNGFGQLGKIRCRPNCINIYGFGSVSCYIGLLGTIVKSIFFKHTIEICAIEKTMKNSSLRLKGPEALLMEVIIQIVLSCNM